MNSPTCLIGIDIGGTKIAGGAVAFPSGQVTGFRSMPTLPARGREAIRCDVEQLMVALRVEARIENAGVGIGICELVSSEGALLTNGTIDWSAPGPIHFEADVRAAALAEALFGRGRNARVFLYVTVGTGISSCLVIDGQPFTGARGATGTLASGPFPLHSAPLEAVASGPGLMRAFGRGASCAEDVFAAANGGDVEAVRLIRSGGTALGAAIGWLVNVLDPEMVVLGGGIGLRPGLFRDSLVASAREHIWWPGHRDLPILSAETGPVAGVIGAAAACLSFAERDLIRKSSD